MEVHTLVFKDTSRKFLTAHLAILNLRETGEMWLSGHVVIPKYMLLWWKEPFMFGEQLTE